jgi:hypothetical protein
VTWLDRIVFSAMAAYGLYYAVKLAWLLWRNRP